MKLLLLVPLLVLNLYAEHYDEPADTYMNLGYKMGLVSESHSEHLDMYVDIQHRFFNGLFAVGRYGTSRKTQDTFDQQCREPYGFTNVCPPSHVVDNSVTTSYVEYGISFHLLENSSGYGEIEVVNRNGIDNGYFDGITTTLGYGHYISQDFGVGIRSGISTATGWNLAGSFFVKF